MANYGTYATLAQLKAELNIADTTDDARLLRKLETASRAIDEPEWGCGRHFYLLTATRYYTPEHSRRLLIDDLLSVTTLKTDDDGDLDYDYTWDSGDYLLEPFNEYPRTQIRVHPDGNYTFPAGRPKSVELAGECGYGDGESAAPYVASGATVTVADATTTTVSVSDQSLLEVGQTILVGSERMYVRSLTDAVGGDTALVYRRVNGSTAAAHVAAAASIYQYPLESREACLLIAARLFRRGEAPFGVVGSAEFGSARIMTRDPDVRGLLNPYRRITVG